MIKNVKVIFNALLVFLVGWCVPAASRADQVTVWGYYSDGQTNVPASATNVIALAAGDNHCLALRGDGTVVAWGANYSGQTNVPSNLTNVVGVAAGSSHSLALSRDGTVTLWGKVPPTAQQSATVPADATNISVLALGPGAQHGLFLRADGTVLDWGLNDSSLTNIPPLARNVVAVAAGSDFGAALRADGRVVAWGENSVNNYVTNVPASATNIVAIATGFYSVAAVRADGTVLIWGDIYGAGLGLTNVVDVACPFDFQAFPNSSLLALRRDGTLIASQFSFPSLPPYPTNNIAGIAACSGDGLMLVGSGPPVFPGIPVNRTVATGARAYFRALAVGSMPMGYHWICNGTNVPGATNPVLVLTNVQPEQAGNSYSLVASNALGMATNGVMILNELPVDFAIQPPALSIFLGATANFSTAYTNGIGSFTFQWQFGNTNLPNATNSSLSLSNVQLNQAGAYSLIVSNSYGSATNYATLTVMPLVFNATSTNLEMTTNGLQLRLDSIYATNSVLICASTDLLNWVPIFTNPPTTGSLMFLDVAATNTPQRFYRALEQ